MRFVRFEAATALLVLVLLAAACGGDGADETVDPVEPQATEPAQTSLTTSTTAPVPDGAVLLGGLQIVGVQFGDTGFVRVENRGTSDVDVNGVYICQFPQYTDLGTVVTRGVIAAGVTVEIPASVVGGLSDQGGEAALYANNADFGSPDNILAYVQWGTGGARADVATAANIWAGPDVSISPDPSFNDIVLDGDPADPEAWS
ncbi:MAG: hypothetical protein OXB92_09045 [Acidimicrobiaceae bacterium]|nr:hypothetical protein [Acidimicrobiia bacterium]MCY4493985.1 hypothetical protein [Acidimicrobiaceae bacterium]